MKSENTLSCFAAEILRNALLLLLLIACFSGFGKEIPVGDAQTVAQNWKLHISLLKKGSADIERTKTSVYNGKNTYYAFSFKGGGFVIVSADDNVSPILAYSDDGYLPDVITNESVKGWLRNYDEQIYTLISSGSQIPNPESNKAWVELSNNRFSIEKGGKGAVGPLLSTKWDQGCFYNTLCPANVEGHCGHVPSGCVAVAMAQVMKYHNYPLHGTGSHSYTSWGYGKQTADFANALYDYDAMPDSLTGENTEVAKLMYHCGVGVDMSYGVSGSGAYDSDIRYALRVFFKFPNAELYYRNGYSDNDWTGIIKTQINFHQPVIYCGALSYGAGHCFVCDGYDANGLFHFNWGWSGQADGYFLISNLNPEGYNFNYNQVALIGVFPNKPQPVADFISDEKYINAGNSISFTDKSYYASKWEWSFPGGTPATSSLRNPTVTYTTIGTYSVTLKVSNYYGSNSKTVTNYLVYNPGQILCENMNSPFPGTLSLFPANNGGYITGNNGYKDKAKADYFESYPDDRSLTGAYFKFGAAKHSSGTNPNIAFCVWDNTGSNGLPGKVIMYQYVPLSKIVDDVANKKGTYVRFLAPVKITAPYYVGVLLPTTTGDEIALYSNKNLETTTNMAFEQWSGGGWHDLSLWFLGAYKVLDLYIQPNFCTTNIPFELSTDKDTTICAGQTVKISSQIKGGKPPYIYKWNTAGTALSIMVSPTQITTYKLTVTDSDNKTLIDSTTVYAYPVPSITQQPLNQIACEGQSAIYSIDLTGGTGCFYQWQLSTNMGQTYTNIPVSDPIFMMMSDYKTPKASKDMNNNRYRCIISSPCGITLTTSAATLTVNYPPAINMQPVSIAVCPGTKAIFSISTTGSLLSYQWQQSIDGGNIYTNISNATINKFTINTVTSGMNNYKYRCIVSGYCLPLLTSSAATLTIDNSCGTCSTLNYPLKGTQTLYRTALGYASGTNEFKFSSLAQYFKDLPANYSLTGVKIKFTKPKGANNRTVTVKVWDNTGLGDSPQNVLAQKTITYLQIKTDVTNNVYSNITFDTPILLTRPVYVGIMIPTATTDSIAIVTNHDGEGMAGAGWLCYSDKWYAFNSNPLHAYKIDLAISAVICKNCPNLNVSVEASRSPVLCQGEAVTLSAMIEDNVFYQWMKDDINIAGATTSAYTTTLAAAYKVKVKNADSCSATSSALTVIVNPLPKPSLGADRTINTNQNIILDPGSSYYSYQWSNGTNEPTVSINGSELSPGSYTYSVIVTDNNGCSANTSVKITISSNFYSLSGKVIYDNVATTPLANTKVILANAEGHNTDSTYTDASGNYTFTNLQAGAYTLNLKPASKWGGADPTDALLLSRNFIGTYSLTNKLRLEAADVNLDTKINPTDALVITRRFVKLTSSFKQKNWVFEPTEIFVTDINTVCNIICICAGDVNATYNGF